MSTTVDFAWPWQYSFPPFFTVQPNTDTHAKQMEDWCELVLNYFKFHGLYKLDVTEAQASPLFYNKTIERKLPLDGIYQVLEQLKVKGCVEWEDSKARNRCYIFWRNPEEWADVIFEWVKSNGLDDTVCTLYELVSDEGTADRQFIGLDMFVLKRALQALERRGKAKLLIGENSVEEDGVKFFS